MRSCSNSSTYYHHNHGFIIRTRCFHNWQWEDISSWLMMIKKQFSSNIIHLGILQDCAWTWKQLWWRIQHYRCPCRVGILQEICLDETAQFQSGELPWIMTWTYRRKIKIQIDTFINKTETNQVHQFLLCQVFLCFGSSPQGQIYDLKHASHPNKTSRPTSSAGGELGDGVSARTSLITPHFSILCVFYDGFFQELGNAWTIHRNCPPSALSPWSYILFQKNFQMWTASSCSYFTIHTN